MDAATGKFIRMYGNPMRDTACLTLDSDDPVYSTHDISDIHRIMRLGSTTHKPFDLPAIDQLEDEFYCVAVVKRYGSMLPGGDPVLLSTALMKVDLHDIKTPRAVPSRKFSETPQIILKRCLPADVLARLEGMSPEFIVVNTSVDPIDAGDFVLPGERSLDRVHIGEVVHAQPLPESWPLSAKNEADGLALLFVDYASKKNSYSLSELSLTEVAEPPVMMSPKFP